MEEKFDYSKAVARLEEIASMVEDPDTPLQGMDSLVLESRKLSKDCRNYLRSVREKAEETDGE